MANYFNTINPWAQLAVMGRTIGDSLAGSMYQQPQIRYELQRQQQQDAQNEWYKQQQLKLAQQDNDRQLATSLLHNQNLQLSNNVLSRNAAIARQVRQLGQQNAGQVLQREMLGQPGQASIVAPSESVYDLFGPRTTPTNALYRDLNDEPNVPQMITLGQPSTGGSTIRALQNAQSATEQALGNEQAAMRGQLAPVLLGQVRQDNLMTLGALNNQTKQLALGQRADEFDRKMQLGDANLNVKKQEIQVRLANAKQRLEHLKNYDTLLANRQYANNLDRQLTYYNVMLGKATSDDETNFWLSKMGQMLSDVDELPVAEPVMVAPTAKEGDVIVNDAGEERKLVNGNWIRIK